MIGFEVDGVSYEQVFMIAPNVVPVAILGVGFLQENNVVINFSDGRCKTRKDGSVCEHKRYVRKVMRLIRENSFN